MTGSDDPQTGERAGSDAASYLCPCCTAAEYPTETMVRVHVSYAEDEDHEGRDGMTPEVEPIELDESGEPVGRAFTLPGDLNLHGLELADIPAVYDGQTLEERERRALLVVAFSANRDVPETELQDRVTAHLEQHDLDPLSVRELRRLCGSFFAPHTGDDGASADTESGTAGDREDETAEITTAETTLRDLTPLQQAIVLAHVARPELDTGDLAAQVGTARSYPAQVADARRDLVERLRTRVEHHGGLRQLVAARVPDADIETMLAEGYLSGFDIDPAAILADGPAGPADPAVEDTAEMAPGARHPAGDDPPRDGGEDGPETDERGDPGPGSVARDGDHQHPGGPATGDPEDESPGEETPDDSGGESSGEDTSGRASGGESPGGVHESADAASASGTDRARRDDTAQSAQEGPAAGRHAPGDGRDEMVPRAEIERVREQVRFDLAVVEQEMELADPTPEQVRTRAYLEQVLERLDDILS